MLEVKTICPYCGVGCGIVLNIDESDRIAWVDDDPTNQSSQGMLCVKGRFGLSFVNHEDRLTTPLIRRDGVLEPASWDEALDLVADKLVEHRGSFAALASAKATNEDGYVLQKLTRLLMGTNSIAPCTRLCHAPSVAAMLTQLGSGATSNSYEDYDAAACFMVIGSDTTSNHPVIASRLRRAIDDLMLTPIAADYSTVSLGPEEQDEDLFEDAQALEAEVGRLEREMLQAAERLDFEVAAERRDRIRYLRRKAVLQ